MDFRLLWGKQIASGTTSGKPRPIDITTGHPGFLEVKQWVRCEDWGWDGQELASRYSY